MVEKKKRQMNKKRLLIAILVSLGLVLGISGIAMGGFVQYLMTPDSEIVDGVKIGPVTVSEANPETARKQVEEWTEQALSQKVKLEYEDKSWNYSLEELGIEADIDRALAEAAEIGRKGNLWNRFQDYRTGKKDAHQVTLHYIVDPEAVNTVITSATESLTVFPVEAAITLNEREEIIVTAHQSGSRIDSEAAVQIIGEKLSSGMQEHEPFTNDILVALNKTEVSPVLTKEELEKQSINGVLASFSTKFNASEVNRTFNVKVAAAALNHQLIKPGETFSFNGVVGPRSTEAGYKEAKVIVKNEFVPGLGGGVCQVSSTLYNALLLADLKIVERSNHSLPVGYVPAGRDATVAYGSKDLRFQNNTDSYILLQSKVQGNTLTIQVFGDKQYKKDVQISSQVIGSIAQKVIEKPNPNLDEGTRVIEQKGANGVRAQAFVTVKQNGTIIRQERIANDTYNPVDQIVQVGTKKVAVAPETVPAGEKSAGSADEKNNGTGEKKNSDSTGENKTETKPKTGSDSTKKPANNSVNTKPESTNSNTNT